LFDSFPRHFAAFHALHRHLAPRHPPYALSSLTTMIPASPQPVTEQPANRKTAIHVFSHGHATASAAEWPPISPKFQELKNFRHMLATVVHTQIGCLKLSPDKSSTRCHSDLLPNCQRTFSAENQLGRNHPCGLKPMQTKHLQGLQTTASVRLTKPERVTSGSAIL
jgi:hypothetical protein